MSLPKVDANSTLSSLHVNHIQSRHVDTANIPDSGKVTMIRRSEPFFARCFPSLYEAPGPEKLVKGALVSRMAYLETDGG